MGTNNEYPGWKLSHSSTGEILVEVTSACNSETLSYSGFYASGWNNICMVVNRSNSTLSLYGNNMRGSQSINTDMFVADGSRFIELAKNSAGYIFDEVLLWKDVALNWTSIESFKKAQIDTIYAACN